MATTHPIHFGTPSVPVHFAFTSPDGETHYLWGHLCSSDPEDVDLWLGINMDAPDLILRGEEEITAFYKWLRILPEYPHMNSRVGIKVMNTHPALAGEYTDAQHLVIPCVVALEDGVKVYVLTDCSADPGEVRATTRWPCTASLSLAESLSPLVEVIQSRTLDLRPTNNPLDDE